MARNHIGQYATQHSPLRAKASLNDSQRMQRSGSRMSLVAAAWPLALDVRILSSHQPDVALKPRPVLAQVMPQPGNAGPLRRVQVSREFRGARGHRVQVVT